MNPFFKIYTGPMFGSKTTRLVAEIDRSSYKGRKIYAFKAKKDKRYEAESISTHSGVTWPAICIDEASEIISCLNINDNLSNVLIAVDEAFMINGIDEVLTSLFFKGANIVVSSIQLDANEKPFENIKNIMPFATHIEICPAVCTKCNNDAYYTAAMFDIDNATAEERVGSKGMYEPRCAKHYKAFLNYE